jgi:HEAT repeats
MATRLTPKIRDLVSPDRLDRPPIKGLTAAHIEALAAVARKPEAAGERVSAPRAIEALARGAKLEVSIPVLSEVVSNQAAPATNRVVAARALGQLGVADAEQALARRVTIREPRVQQAVFWALGATGGPTALRALTRIEAVPDPAANRQLVLARALIAHRHGLNGPFLPPMKGIVRSPEQVEEKADVALRLKTERATANDRNRLVGSTYGIDLAARGAELSCGRNQWTLFFNRELDPATAAGRLLERPWVGALMGKWHIRGKSLVTQFILLTRPEDRAARIDVVRTDGTLVYTGKAESDNLGLSFLIADIERPGTAPTTLSGRLTSKGLTLERVVASARRVGSQFATPVTL